MPPSRIMVMRHAEKPSDDGTVAGVAEDGSVDPESLTVQGWQRAGALVRFFAPLAPCRPPPGIETPGRIFATASGPGSRSRRPLQTVTPLSRAIGVPVDQSHTKGAEADLAGAVLRCDGPVLVSWHHEAILSLLAAIAGPLPGLPPKWPGTRFDVAVVLNRQGAGWAASQVPQLLLVGDMDGGL